MLSDVDFENKIVLDAGTGGWSARFLAQRGPGKIVCVAGPGDIRKEEEARNALQSLRYENYRIIMENLIGENLFPENSFDFIFAHYLVEEVDGFAPLGICEVLNNLYKFLYWVVRCCNSKNDFLNDLALLYFGEKRKQSPRSQRLLCNLCKNQRTTSS